MDLSGGSPGMAGLFRKRTLAFSLFGGACGCREGLQVFETMGEALKGTAILCPWHERLRFFRGMGGVCRPRTRVEHHLSRRQYVGALEMPDVRRGCASAFHQLGRQVVGSALLARLRCRAQLLNPAMLFCRDHPCASFPPPSSRRAHARRRRP